MSAATVWHSYCTVLWVYEHEGEPMAKRILVALDETTAPEQLPSIVSGAVVRSGATVRLLNVAPMSGLLRRPGCLAMLAIRHLVGAIAVAAVLGGTAVAETPMLPRQSWAPASCEAGDDPEVSEIGAVLQIITGCQDALGLTAAQRDELGALTAQFITTTVRRDAKREVAADELAALLEPDPDDPGRPLDFAAAEAAIREIQRLATDQELAALRVIEAKKAVLTAAQRVTLAALLRTARARAVARLVL